MKKTCFLIYIIIFLFTIKGASAEDTAKIILLHTNDIHGRLFPYDNPIVAEPPVMTGGFQYLATVINKERSENPGKVLLLDGGDTFQGSMYSNLSFGIPVIELMNYLRYDAMVLGNHDFDWSEEKLMDLISTAGFPVLSSNVIMKDNGDFIKGAVPYTVKNINGVRTGIIGLTTDNTSIMGPSCETFKYDFLSPEETVKKYITLLENIHKAELIIVLSHLGLYEDQILAEKVPEIDIIVGAHTHTAIFEPILAGKTIILQADCYLSYLGRLEIEFDKEKKEIISYQGKLIKIVDSDIEPDSEVSFLLKDYTEKYDLLAKEIVGVESGDLIRDSWNESTIGNLFADIIKDAGKTDMGFINSKGIRADILSGNVTMEEIYAAYPFDDILVSMELSGKDILEILEISFNGEHSILQVSSGLELEYNRSNPVGQRLIEAKFNGEMIEPDRIYTVTTIYFLSTGKDDYEPFVRGKNLKNLILARDAIRDYFKSNSPVTGKIDGRIEIEN